MYGEIMFNNIKQKTIVKQEGRIEVLSPELPVDATVEIIILLKANLLN